MEFSRELNTRDPADNEISFTGTTTVVWALSDAPPPADENNILYHSDRGSESLNLVGQPDDVPQLEPDIFPLDLQVENVNVPSVGPDGQPADTVYWCKAFQLPSDRKRHAVFVEPVIDPRFEQNVHHILIYWCDTDLGDDINFEGPCYDRPGGLSCLGNAIVSGWAVGGQGEYSPEGVGLPIGIDGPQQVIMEIHYDNPNLIPNIVDSSGMRFWLTEQLRPIDSGLIMAGQVVESISIPPGEVAFDTVGYCSSACTQDLPPEGVTIFSNVLHAHIAAVAIKVQHIRDGVELPPVYDDQNYDFNYQQSYKIKPEVKLMPGDDLIVTCTYNTEGRNETTLGGESTREEMCFAYLSYYPANTAINVCISNPIFLGTQLQICGVALPRIFTPGDFEPLPADTKCLDYEKPDLSREPTRMTFFDPSVYIHSARLGADEQVSLYWNYDYETEILDFAVDVEAVGWAGFGISQNGGMTGSDVVIGYLDNDGEPHFRDRFAFAPALPPIDISQDLFNIRVGKFLVERWNNTKTYKSMF
eukprot:TRINITY_DN417_c0_g1_i3.p1 TRINITY_DN417_c0_g1~~TRINITY_DN417_c0_g1_i3.p1  ORF type:complete len:530 (-),score=130.38 TRINITY_DN417_c0_g1_i3:126-1715(-)